MVPFSAIVGFQLVDDGKTEGSVLAEEMQRTFHENYPRRHERFMGFFDNLADKFDGRAHRKIFGD